MNLLAMRYFEMSDRPNGAAPANPDNPYNIDHARERRLARIFKITIGAGFAFAIILLVIGYAMDALLSENLPDKVPAVTPYNTPAQSSDGTGAPR